MEKEVREAANKRLAKLIKQMESETDSNRKKDLLNEINALGDLIAKDDKNELDNSRLTDEYDQKQKENDLRKLELELRETDLKLKEIQTKNEKKATIWSNILKGIGTGVTAAGMCLWAWMSLKTMEFEETGTIRSKAWPGLNNPDLKSKFKNN